ncbi:MAG TPA: hypothetical protein VGJ05_20700 [Fimbriiglobus sp.]|jgi:hypothetical protein
MSEMTPISTDEQFQVEGGATIALPSEIVKWIKTILNTPPTHPVPDKPIVHA